MTPRFTDEQAEAILRGEGTPDVPEMADLIARIRALGEHPIDPDVITHRVAMILREAGISEGAPGVMSNPPARRPVYARYRRSIVFSSLLSSLLGKVFAASIAIAAVGGGVGYVADGAIPGDVLYGIDRAMEVVGLGRGGADERLEEARALVDQGRLPEAVATAGDAAEEAKGEEAASALRSAAATIEAVEEGAAAELTRERVAELLELLAVEIEEGGVIGEDVAEMARSIAGEHDPRRGEVDLPDQAKPPVSPGAPGTVPSGDAEEADSDPAEASVPAPEGEDAVSETPGATTPDTTIPSGPAQP